MPLIFDRFKSVKDAALFAAVVKTRYGRDAQIYTSREDAADAGQFPFQLAGEAVVLVDRETYLDEEAIVALVQAHGGEFAGT